jgi:heme/copper-type cytochrome/quinol oxidase subunit 1
LLAGHSHRCRLVHFFWSFGHPEACILMVPAFAMVADIIPAFSRTCFATAGPVAAAD